MAFFCPKLRTSVIFGLSGAFSADPASTAKFGFCGTLRDFFSEGKSWSPEMIKVQRGHVVKMVCNDQLMWLGLQKGDSFFITVTHVEEYNSWEEMLSASTLENLLPTHVLSRGRQKIFKLDDALELYQGLFYWPLTNGRNGAMRFDVRTRTIDHK